MSLFSVGSFSSNGNDSVRGQSFTPNVAGPNGSGGPGTSTHALIKYFSIGYPTGTTSGRATKVFVYSQEVEDPSDIEDPAYLIAESITDGFTDLSDDLGTGSYSRRFNFSMGTLNVGSKYFVYYDADQYVRVDTRNPYSGGHSYDTLMQDMDPTCSQFKVDLDSL